MTPTHRAVLDDIALTWARRTLWLVCAAVYLTVFIGGILAGGDELMTVARAVGFTLATGFLGHQAVGLLSKASLPIEPGPSAEESRPVGSLIGLIESTNVAQQDNTAEAA